MEQLEELTKKQKEVKSYLLDYYNYKTNKKIADKLNISLQAVKNHATEIYSKEGVGDRVELLLKYCKAK